MFEASTLEPKGRAFPMRRSDSTASQRTWPPQTAFTLHDDKNKVAESPHDDKNISPLNTLPSPTQPTFIPSSTAAKRTNRLVPPPPPSLSRSPQSAPAEDPVSEVKTKRPVPAIPTVPPKAPWIKTQESIAAPLKPPRITSTFSRTTSVSSASSVHTSTESTSSSQESHNDENSKSTLDLTPPSLPHRPQLPPRPTPPPRPVLPTRPSSSPRPPFQSQTKVKDPPLPLRPKLPQRPELPKRPELPQRPALPNRPSASQSTTTTSRFSQQSTSTNGQSLSSSLATYRSTHSSSTATSTTCTFKEGDDAITILKNSAPVFTSEFNGERLDLKDADFSVQDDHARACPPSESTSVARLSHYLTSPFPGDLVAQLRAIFAWMAENISYDTHGLTSGQMGDQSSDDVLRSRKGVCAGYSNLFHALSPPQLGVIIVSGVAKGFGSEPGDGSLGCAHAWNAVNVAGEMLLIDSTWGSGHVDDQDNYHKGFKPHYFLTRPHRFIYNHWPKDRRQQFLDPPISEAVYMGLPMVTSYTWSLGIKTGTGTDLVGGSILRERTQRTHTIWTEDDSFEVEVRLRMRDGDGLTPRLRASLSWPPTGKANIATACQWTRVEGRYLIMTIRGFCPGPGTGSLSVYGISCDKPADGFASLVHSYRVINHGTGQNAQPIMETFFPQDEQFKVSFLEPLTAQVQSGVTQRIRVMVYENVHGTRVEMVLIQISNGVSSRPEPLHQVEEGIFEICRVLRPGQYHIGLTKGFQASVIGTFNAV
ncbi:hypothetical protein BGW38_002173 [Lunasporangiospora selenospora]|uniref:Transglutaminase-like domain-containing protein n=1 Tax=Lunasporangiospora selenospora TaxID=979761 RepID=A0A9P6G0Z3_9FUNG|nr:hypothetical protein BGW38_002173 [Lunasporangiospora selenospora]